MLKVKSSDAVHHWVNAEWVKETKNRIIVKNHVGEVSTFLKDDDSKFMWSK